MSDNEANSVRESPCSAMGKERFADLDRQDHLRVRLTRKYAERIDGVDLRAHSVGDVLDLPATEGRLLIAEEWAIPERR